MARFVKQKKCIWVMATISVTVSIIVLPSGYLISEPQYLPLDERRLYVDQLYVTKNTSERLVTYTNRNLTNEKMLTFPHKLAVENTSDEYLLVLFTTFTLSTKRKVVYNNSRVNWPRLSRNIKAVIFTNESIVKHSFEEAGWNVIPLSYVTKSGTPFLKFMFLEIARRYSASFIGYANADILFTDSLLKNLIFLKKYEAFQNKDTLIVGKRTNVRDLSAEESKTNRNLQHISSKRGKLHRPDAEDYFITNHNYPWKNIPEVVVGRSAYDNFLVLHARINKYNTIDISLTNTAIHQTVDRGHLEEPWKRQMEERLYNVRVIEKLYGRVNYKAGQINCATFFTIYNNHFQILVRKRKSLKKICTY